MTDRKLLFSDLDDTLLNSDKNISPENLRAIRDLVHAGHGFVICTGRPLYSARLLADQYGFTGEGYYIASFNGGQIVDQTEGRVLHRVGITPRLTRFLLDAAHERGIHAHTYCDSHVLTEWDTEIVRFYAERIRMPYRVVENVLDHTPDSPPKVIVADFDHEKLLRFQEEMKSLTEKDAECMFSNPILLEYGSYEAGKGKAVTLLSSMLGIKIENTFAIGDEENDLSMIRAAGCGIAMSNGTDIVKQTADVITRNDCNHSGVAEIIHEYILK